MDFYLFAALFVIDDRPAHALRRVLIHVATLNGYGLSDAKRLDQQSGPDWFMRCASHGRCEHQQQSESGKQS